MAALVDYPGPVTTTKYQPKVYADVNGMSLKYDKVSVDDNGNVVGVIATDVACDLNDHTTWGATDTELTSKINQVIDMVKANFT